MNDVWTVQRILTWTSNYFASKQLPDPRLSAELLLARVLNCRRVDLYIQFERILSARERENFREFVKRRAAREPVQYILGETEFMGFPFRVSPAVLIPRPETELLVDAVVEELRERNPAAKILDIGTGSGCIAVSLQKLLPQAEIWAVDISADALAVARQNAEALDARVEFLVGNIFDSVLPASLKFDAVVSNPPYVAEKDWPSLEPEVAEYEPKLALQAGVDGLDFYRGLVEMLDQLLNPGGKVYLETGYDQAQVVAEMLQAKNYLPEIRRDLNQIERFVIAAKASS